MQKYNTANTMTSFRNQITVTPDQTTTQPTYFKEAYFAGVNTSPTQYGGLVPIIAIYEIDWATYNAATRHNTALSRKRSSVSKGPRSTQSWSTFNPQRFRRSFCPNHHHLSFLDLLLEQSFHFRLRYFSEWRFRRFNSCCLHSVRRLHGAS